MTDRLPVGVVGVGALGRHHARHLAAMPGVELVGVCDVDPARGAEVAANTACQFFHTLDDLLDRVRAVSIAVPTVAHHETGLHCLGRGVAVLMEKPLAASLAEADELLAEAERHDLVFAVGHVERFNRAVRAARDVLDRPLFFEGARLAPFQLRGTDVPVVLDLMIHDLDLALHLAGAAVVTDVRASGVSILSPHLDMVSARVEFLGGTVASMTSSRVARDRVRRLRIFQASGYISLDLGTGSATFMRLRDGWRQGTGSSIEEIVEVVPLDAPEADALGLELAAFIDAVQGVPAEVVSAIEGRAALALALEVSAAVQRTPVPVLGR
ncbi:MAG TPA: Gfo/Idh/MocA family oxidoreductase [Gemmatimonadales bacterium]|nr:Gfo/Idh/MocA family oxidoreductase [Gemmatimonadales bacterium]